MNKIPAESPLKLRRPKAAERIEKITDAVDKVFGINLDLLLTRESCIDYSVSASLTSKEYNLFVTVFEDSDFATLVIKQILPISASDPIGGYYQRFEYRGTVDCVIRRVERFHIIRSGEKPAKADPSRDAAWDDIVERIRAHKYNKNFATDAEEFSLRMKSRGVAKPNGVVFDLNSIKIYIECDKAKTFCFGFNDKYSHINRLVSVITHTPENVDKMISLAERELAK